MYYLLAEKVNKYISLDIFVCSIAVYLYESRSILESPNGESIYDTSYAMVPSGPGGGYSLIRA